VKLSEKLRAISCQTQLTGTTEPVDLDKHL
jgi:hypothetical protein